MGAGGFVILPHLSIFNTALSNLPNPQSPAPFRIRRTTQKNSQNYG